MEVNFLILALAALIPLAIGMIWYNPKVMGSAWMKETKLSEADMKGANMAVIFGLTYLFSFMASMFLMQIVIHQWGMFSLFQGEPGINDPAQTSEAAVQFKALITQYGDRFRSFKHGVLHGTITALFFVLPITAIGAMFERKSWKYIWISVGYWVICLALMGGIICQFS